MDAYVFSGSGSTEAHNKLKAVPEGVVRYGTKLLSGPYGMLAFVRTDGDDPAELENKLTALRDAVNSDTALAIAYGPNAPSRWSPKPKFAAYVRVRVERGWARKVLDATSHLDTYWGSAIVAGSYDILLELGADTFGELHQDIGEHLQQIEGITWTESAYAINKPKETWMR